MLPTIGTWLLVAASIIGVILNIRRRPECFVIWSVTNAAWAVVDAVHGLWSQAFLQAVYFALAVWGLIEWTRFRRTTNDEAGCDSPAVGGKSHPRKSGDLKNGSFGESTAETHHT